MFENRTLRSLWTFFPDHHEFSLFMGFTKIFFLGCVTWKQAHRYLTEQYDYLKIYEFISPSSYSCTILWRLFLLISQCSLWIATVFIWTMPGSSTFLVLQCSLLSPMIWGLLISSRVGTYSKIHKIGYISSKTIEALLTQSENCTFLLCRYVL